MKRNYSIQDMHNLANKYGGKCFSANYINANTKLKFKCNKDNYEWEASPKSIMNGGHWCPKCAGQAKITIDELQNIAKSNGGKCLSTVYVNIFTKLLWECKYGHKWWSKPVNIRNNGTWCPVCSGCSLKNVIGGI